MRRRHPTVKAVESVLGIILVIASVVPMSYWSRGSLFKNEEGRPFEVGFLQNPVGAALQIVLGLALLAGGELVKASLCMI
jgi:hypothetical protein